MQSNEAELYIWVAIVHIFYAVLSRPNRVR